MNRALELAKDNSNSILHNKSNEQVWIDDVREAAKYGDKVAIKAYNEAGYNLGLGLVSAINLFNISTIIMADEGVQAEEWLTPNVLNAVTNSFFSRYIDIEVKKSELGNIGWELGTVALVIKELFQVPLYKDRFTLYSS